MLVSVYRILFDAEANGVHEFFNRKVNHNKRLETNRNNVE